MILKTAPAGYLLALLLLAGCVEQGILAPEWNEPGAPLRSTASLDGTWTFIPQGYQPRPVKVPCFWEALDEPGYDLTCPGYLDGTPDEGLWASKFDTWDKRTIHRGFYLRELEIDVPTPVTKVWFEALHHQATIWVNDQKIGEHTGPYWKVGFDVSPAIQAGKNVLQVDLLDGNALLGPDGRTDWPVGWYSLSEITGIYRPVTLEHLPAIYVADSFIVSSVRRHDLTIQYTITNSTDAAVKVWLRGRVLDQQGQAALEIPVDYVEIPAAQSTEVVVVQPWLDARRWSPQTPYLYTLRTLLMDEVGQPIDLRDDRFGFREVWIESGNFMLNGMRMNLIGDSVDDQAGRARYWAERYFSCSTARETLQRIKALNINFIRFHQAPPPDCVHDLADELGLLIMPESTIYARMDILPILHQDETYLENAAAWLTAWVKRQRNHPSTVIWSLENEMYIFGLAFTRAQLFDLQEPVKEQDTIKRPDGTKTRPRPVSWDGDSSLMYRVGNTFPFKVETETFPVETVNWHYPYDEWSTTDPLDEWFDDALTHFAPYLVHDVPCGIGETTSSRPHELPANRSYSQIKAKQGQVVRALRILGFDDIRPYKLNWAWHTFYPDGTEHPTAKYYHSLYSQEEKDRLLTILKDSYHPIAVFDLDYTRAQPNLDGTIGPLPLPENSAVERTLVIFNDSLLEGKPQQVTWTALDQNSGEVLAHGSFVVEVEEGESDQVTIGFTTPARGTDPQPHPVVLRLTSSMDGLAQGDFSTEYRFVLE